MSWREREYNHGGHGGGGALNGVFMLLHEFGHCIAARMVWGRPEEIAQNWVVVLCFFGKSAARRSSVRAAMAAWVHQNCE
jgi:hypothetical protein